MDNKKILEALQMQPLSDEEKASRHILGRLYGPIATTKESTRNGRKYNAELWSKALNDEIFREKVANKALFLELGHPVDREETDMKCVCACIPEIPKIVDGDLYAYVDILDTANGRLLKTLCDYGFVPGISSRGSGDIMSNNEVDPDTFFLDTWDIVNLPSVKKARLQMCECYSGKTLNQTLVESYNKATDEVKKVMKEALNNLDIKLENDSLDSLKEGLTSDELKRVLAAAKKLNIKTVQELEEFAASHGNLKKGDLVAALEAAAEKKLDEALEVDPEEFNMNARSSDGILVEAAEDDEDDAEEAVEDVSAEAEESEEATEEESTEEVEAEETSEDTEDDVEKTQAFTVGELTKEIKDYDAEQEVEFKPIVINDVEYPVESLLFDETEDGKILVSIGYSQEIGDNKEESEVENATETPDEEATAEDVTETEDVSDAEDEEEVMESLKEMIRQKDMLECQVQSLKSDKTVSDAKVEELTEELRKYKGAFERVGEIAAKATKLEKEVSNLNESLIHKDKQISQLKEANKSSLNEGLEKSSATIKKLQESILAKEQENKAIETQLTEQVNAYKAKLNESIKVTNSYKTKCNALLEAYVSFRAQMLGVKPADITNRLSEKYTISDIDKACDTILTHSVNASSFPYVFNESTKIRINESKQVSKQASDDYDFDSLYELAGLK